MVGYCRYCLTACYWFLRYALMPDRLEARCHCYRMSAGHVMPADKHNLSERRRRPGGFNKRHCQRRLLSAHICITPHAVDRDFQARKQESVTAKSRQIQGHDRPPTPACCRHHSLPQAIFQVVYYCGYRSDTTRLLLRNCHHPALPGYMPPRVLVHARARARAHARHRQYIHVVTGSQDQAVQITVRSWPSRIHALIVRR